MRRTYSLRASRPMVVMLAASSPDKRPNLAATRIGLKSRWNASIEKYKLFDESLNQY